MVRLGPREIERILTVTDAFNLHREYVVIPLRSEGDGRVEVSNGKLLIVAPETTSFDKWVDELHTRLHQMDLRAIPRKSQ